MNRDDMSGGDVTIPAETSLLDAVAQAIQPHISPVAAAVSALAVVRDYIAALPVPLHAVDAGGDLLPLADIFALLDGTES